MTYILGILCFAAIVLSAIMLISSVHIRKIDSRFWSIFLCISLVCSFAFYSIHKSVLSHKTAPTIDFSGFTPEIEEESDETESREELSEEHTETENTDENAEFDSESDGADGENSENPDTESEPSSYYVPSGQAPDEPVYGDNIGDNDAPGDPSYEASSSDEDAAGPLPSQSENVTPKPPEIEYEGPFRTE